jgi:hypothetical protein
VTVNVTASTRAAKDEELWTVRALLVRHKLAAAGLAAVIAVMLAMILVAVLGSKGGAVSDSTTCSQWSSANESRQAAYARLYVREHGQLPSGDTSPAGVIGAINKGCNLAFGEDVSDTVTVVQAISGRF